MPNKQQVIELHRGNPGLTSKQIAVAILGAGAGEFEIIKADGWVRATGQRNGITFARAAKREKGPRIRQDSIFVLGRACRDAGLTVAEIKDIAEAFRN